MNVLLGITGSIAAINSCQIAGALKKQGHTVKAVMSKGGERFITPLSVATITENRVLTSMWDEDGSIQHIELARWADVFVIAPASASIIAYIAQGIPNGIVGTIALAIEEKIPKLFAPAMNTQMYMNPLTQRNINTLKEVGWIEIPPVTQTLACGEVGVGAMAKKPTIIQMIESAQKGENQCTLL